MNDQTDGGRSAAALCSGGAAPNMGMASITRNSHRCFDEKTSINTSMEKKTPSTLILHKTSKHEESSLRMDIQQSLVREASPQIPFVYFWRIFWGIFRILEREKMPDNFQKKGGGGVNLCLEKETIKICGWRLP